MNVSQCNVNQSHGYEVINEEAADSTPRRVGAITRHASSNTAYEISLERCKSLANTLSRSERAAGAIASCVLLITARAASALSVSGVFLLFDRLKRGGVDKCEMKFTRACLGDDVSKTRRERRGRGTRVTSRSFVAILRYNLANVCLQIPQNAFRKPHNNQWPRNPS